MSSTETVPLAEVTGPSAGEASQAIIANASEASRRPPVLVETIVPTTTGSAVLPALASSTSRAKSKKKRSGSSNAAAGENTGRWTAEEHRLFLQGLEQHGKGWKKIASLIKSRTVVQIRTHAQKYFQKLAKARQNGEEGDVTMEGRGGTASVTSETIIAAPKRQRRQIAGTKRKAIASVVASAQRQGKRLVTDEEDDDVEEGVTPPLPAVAPALAPYILPGDKPTVDANGVPAPGTVTASALEDSLFRFLTPMPPIPDNLPSVNDVARQAGANPITLPADGKSSKEAADGEISPTGVTDLYPSWTDSKDAPAWYAKGADVDALLDVADTLDWFGDTGDLNETYHPPEIEHIPSIPEMKTGLGDHENSASVCTLPRVDSNMESIVPSLPSLFAQSMENLPLHKSSSMTSQQLKTIPSGMLDPHLQVFDTPLEEQDFVSAILEQSAVESHDNLASLS